MDGRERKDVRAGLTFDVVLKHDQRTARLTRGAVKKGAAMRGIHVGHAAWIGSPLARLADEQPRAAFRAASYDEAKTEGYVGSLREHISQLTRPQSLSPAPSEVGPRNDDL